MFHCLVFFFQVRQPWQNHLVYVRQVCSLVPQDTRHTRHDQLSGHPGEETPGSVHSTPRSATHPAIHNHLCQPFRLLAQTQSMFVWMFSVNPNEPSGALTQPTFFSKF